MFRRLYFLLPNAELTQNVVNELLQQGVQKRCVHAVSHDGMPMALLPLATKEQIYDNAHYIEDVLWKANIGLFCIALIMLIYSAVTGSMFIASICLLIMVVTFISGDLFALYMPRINMKEFAHAINHNEVLLMVDVPKHRVADIDDCIHRHHPAAVEGGSSWSIQYMGM